MTKYYYLKAGKKNSLGNGKNIGFWLAGSLILTSLISVWLIFVKTDFSRPVSPLAENQVLSGSVGPNLNKISHFVIPSPTPTPVPTPVVVQQVQEKKYRKNQYSIVIYGDSMVDTMGERLEYLEGSLKKLYPQINFQLYNFGIGSENVEMGMNRWNNDFNYQDRHYQAVSQIKPDIIVLGSFSYNPFFPYDLNRHWLGLSRLIYLAQSTTSRVYLLAEISPLRKSFGSGPNGVNWDQNASILHSGKIIEQLESTIKLGKVLKIPVIDVYEKSGGSSLYVNPSDGIHPSVLGQQFTADLIALMIQLE